MLENDPAVSEPLQIIHDGIGYKPILVHPLAWNHMSKNEFPVPTSYHDALNKATFLTSLGDFIIRNNPVVLDQFITLLDFSVRDIEIVKANPGYGGRSPD